MSTSVKMPAPRNLAEEGRETLETQIQLAPDLFRARSSEQYGDPAYQRLQLDMLEEALPRTLDVFDTTTRRVNTIQSEADAAKRAADIADIERYGPRVQEALRRANPEQYKLLDALSAEASSAGPTALEQRLRDQALTDLSLGDRASAEEMRRASQDARAAFADRGMLRSNPAAVAEVLNRQQVRDSRLQQRRQFAGQVAGLERAGMEADRGFRSRVTGMWGATVADPVMAITGRQSVAQNAAMAQQSAAGAGYGQTAGYFNPFSSYAGDLYNTNYNAAVNAAITNANNSTAITGAAIGAAGSIAGGFMCWVARAAFGERSTTWLRFRHYLLTRAPAHLRTLYEQAGPELADCMRHNPALAVRVGSYMQQILNNQERSAA